MPARKSYLAAVIGVVIIVILAAVTIYALTRSSPSPGPTSKACAGTATYNGVVKDQAGAALGGVVVSLSAAPPYTGMNATVTTDASGAWSASLSGTCPYQGTLYWQSASQGPRLATVAGLNPTSSLGVNVSRTLVSLQLVKEFPNSAGLNISLHLPDLTFSVTAFYSGSIPLAFLPRNEVGDYAVNFTMPSWMNASGVAPYSLNYSGAMAYRVQDMNGNWVVYATPAAGGAFSVGNAAEYLNMTQAIADAQANLTNPYVQVGARSTVTHTWNVTNATHVGTGIVAWAYQVPLEGFFSINNLSNPNVYASAEVPLKNPAGGNICFVVWAPEAINAHAWYYGAGKCP